MRYLLFISIFLIGSSTVTLADQVQDKSFAVVELFSSEGCSSCPPADNLIGVLTNWARKNNEPVYPVVFQVDYWNYLGWQDRFSRPEFSQRQYDYSRILKAQGVYTPQMVVNGSDVFVGSDQEHLQQDIDQALIKPASAVLRISLIKQKGQVLVNYQAQGFLNGDVVNIALVERGLSSNVTAGENAGSTLHHENVVKEFQTLRLKQAPAQATVSLSNIDDPAQASVIAYVQNPHTMVIEAAKQVDVGQ